MRGFHFTSSKTTPAQSPARVHVSPTNTPTHHQTFSASIIEEDLLYAEQIIKRWDLDSPLYTKHDYLFTNDRREARQFIKSVNNLQSAMHFFVSESSSSEKIVHAQKLMQVAMKRLEKEFFRILSSNRDALDSESVSVSVRSFKTRSSISDEDNDNVSEEYYRSPETETSVSVSVSDNDTVLETVMADLKLIADCMIKSGYAKECVNVYKILRKSIIDETLYKLGVEKHTFNQINKTNWDTLEPKIKAWLNAEKHAVKTLFSGERILVDYVFSSSKNIRESTFSDICKNGAVSLFEFPELVAKSKKSMERMFRTLDMYSSISDHWAEIELIFSFESTAVVRSQAVTSLVKLGDAVRLMLTDFEGSMQKEVLKTAVNGAGVHPLTRYVMNYLVFLSDYNEILSDILADWPLEIQSPLPEAYFSNVYSDDTSSISDRFVWLVLVLLCKIDSGADCYNDVGLSYLYLLNNLNYVVLKVQNSGLKNLIGDEWIEKHEEKVKQYVGNYERMAWGKVIQALSAGEAVNNLSDVEARECFRRFNLEFNEAYRKQSTCIITDGKIREVVKMSVGKKILPAYRKMYEKYRGVFRGGESVVKYAPDDLGNYLSGLFLGGGDSGSVSRTSHSSNGAVSRR